MNSEFSEFFVNKYKNLTLSQKFWYIQEIFKENFEQLFNTDIELFYQILFEYKYMTVFDYLIMKDMTISNEKKLELIRNSRKLRKNNYLIVLLKFINEDKKFKKAIKKSLNEIKLLTCYGMQYCHNDFLGIIYIENNEDIRMMKKLIRKISKMDINELEEKYFKIKNKILNKKNNNVEHEEILPDNQNKEKEMKNFLKNIYLKKRKRNKEYKKIKNKYDKIHEIENSTKDNLEYHHIVPVKYFIDNKYIKKIKEKLKNQWEEGALNFEEKKILDDKTRKYFVELNNVNNLLLLKKEVHQYIHKRNLFLIETINNEFIILSNLERTENMKIYNNKDCFYKNNIEKIYNYNKILTEKFLLNE